jgi:hypothetical protein
MMLTNYKPSAMFPRSLFHLGQHLRGTAGIYKITEQISEFIYIAVYVLIPSAYARVHVEQQPIATNKRIP